MGAEPRKLDDILRAESDLLAAFCQEVLAASQRAEALRALAHYRWQNEDHQLIFEALRDLGPRSARELREELPRYLTRKGFPDTALEPLFQAQSLSAPQVLELARALLAHTKRR